MKLAEFTDPHVFADRVADFLLAREAESCIELGVISALTDNAPAGTRGDRLEVPRLWMAENELGEIDALFMQSNKDRALVTRGSDAAMMTIAGHLQETNWREKSINGNSPSVRVLSDEHARLMNRTAQCAINLRVFELRSVIPPRPALGRMRGGDERDRALLEEWTVAFGRDVGDPIKDGEGARYASLLLEGKRAWFWIDEHEQVVAMAAHAGPTPNGIRVNFVYTPPNQRGRGYASNLVAAVAQHHLDAGKKLVFLHTDAKNPTSNKIYQDIGFNFVCDAERWDFAD